MVHQWIQRAIDMSLPTICLQTDMEAPSSSTVYEPSASVTQKAHSWPSTCPKLTDLTDLTAARTVEHELSGTDALVSLRLSAKELAKEKLWPQDAPGCPRTLGNLGKSQEIQDDFRTTSGHQF